MTTATSPDTEASIWAPLARFLARYNVRATSQELAERCGPAATPSAVSAELKRQGLDARVVRIQPHELRCLALPTLLFLRAGQIAVVTRATRRHITLEMAAGEPVRVPLREVEAMALGVALDITAGVLPGRSWLAFLVQCLRRQPQCLAHLITLSLLLALVGLVIPAVTALVMDWALPAHDRSLLVIAALGILGLTVYRGVLGLLRDGVQRTLEARLEGQSRRGLLAHVLRLPYRQTSHLTVGAAMQGMHSVERLTELATVNTLLPIIDVGASILYFLGLVMLLPGAALVTLAIGTVMLGLVAAIASRYAAYQSQELDLGARHQGLLYEIICGLDTLRAASATDWAVERWAGSLLEHRQMTLRRERLAIITGVMVSAGTQAVTLGLFAWGAQACLAGQLTVGALLAAFMLTDGCLGALTRLGLALLQLLSARVHLARLGGVLQPGGALQPAASPRAGTGPSQSRANPAAPSIPADCVVVDNVWFRYLADGPWIVAGESYEVRVGEVMHLRGPSGKGKTTLLRLIAGLLEPEQGAIWVLGCPATAARADVLYLPQDVRLFGGTVLSNLSLLSGAARADILAAAEATGLSEWIAALPMGFETMLPPGGSTLSSGQRQLLLMTAAVASRRRVLLLDEALCHIDRLTQQRVFASALFRDRIVIAVSHDLSSSRAMATSR